MTVDINRQAMAMRIYLSLFSLLPSLVFAVDSSFIIPPPAGVAGDYSANLDWSLDSTQTIQWTCDFPTYELWIFQDNGIANGDPQLLVNGSNSASGQQETTFTWQVETTLNFVTVPAFWFMLYNGTGDFHFASHYINITSPVSTSTSSSLSTSATSISTSSTKSSTSFSTTASSTATQSPTSTPKPGLSTGAKAGIGISVPLAAIAASIAAFFFWRRFNRSKTTTSVSSGPQCQPVEAAPVSGSAYGAYTSGYGKQELPVNVPQPYELDARHDLSGNNVPTHELGEHHR